MLSRFGFKVHNFPRVQSLRNLRYSLSSASEKRVALVIGNRKYRYPLRNAAHDAKCVSRALEAVDFCVQCEIDLKLKKMKKVIDSFGKNLYEANVGLFYFAGHGVQVDGDNYLIPVAASIHGEEDVEYEAVNLGRVLGKMKAANGRIGIVVLDACRNNPFERSFRSNCRGLISVSAPRGTFIAYATAPGSVAEDGKGRNSPFTKQLVNQLAVQGLRIEDVFKRVREEVIAETNGTQVPWDSSSLVGDFYFRPGPSRTDD